jgi:hypothetical protein
MVIVDAIEGKRNHANASEQEGIQAAVAQPDA